MVKFKIGFFSLQLSKTQLTAICTTCVNEAFFELDLSGKKLITVRHRNAWEFELEHVVPSCQREKEILYNKNK